MKRVARLAVPSLVLLGLASQPLACFSSDSTSPVVGANYPPPTDDSGLPSSDATRPAVDAGSSDAGADTATGPDAIDGAPAPLTVNVLVGNTPEPDVLVVFQDPAGAVLSTATTDATGTVSQFVVAGSQLTAVLGTAQNPNLVTVQDVVPGDVVTLLDEPTTSPPNDPQTVAVTLPAATWDSAAANVYMNAGQCGDPLGYDVYLQSTCYAQGKFPLFARATDNTNELAYTYEKGNALASDGGLLAVAVIRPWSTSTATETITASSLPATLDDAGVSLGNVSFDYTEVSGGVPLGLPSLESPTTNGGLPSETFVVHPDYPDFTQEDAIVYLNTPSSSLSQVFAVTRKAPTIASDTTSLALGTLPGFTSASINANDAGTPVQPVVSWTTTGSLSAANGIMTMVQWYAPAPDGGSGTINGTWTIVAPANVTSAQAPSMPASTAAFTPSTNASYNPPRVLAVSASFLAGYSAFKSQFATIPIFTPNGNWSPVVPLLPANGLTLYASAIYPDQG